jgi:Fe-S oxidoreductase
VKHLAAAVRQGFKIVCSEPSAALCLREELRHYVAGEDTPLVAQNTSELMNYLSALRDRGQLKAPTDPVAEKFVYHLPCHLCAVGDDTVTSRKRASISRSTWWTQAGRCGSSGTFGMQQKNYDRPHRF